MGSCLDVVHMPHAARWLRAEVVARGEMPVRGYAEQPPVLQLHYPFAGKPVCCQGHDLARPGVRWAGGQRSRTGVAAKRIYRFHRVGGAQRPLVRASRRADSDGYRQNRRPERDGAVPHNVQTVAGLVPVPKMGRCDKFVSLLSTAGRRWVMSTTTCLFEVSAVPRRLAYLRSRSAAVAQVSLGPPSRPASLTDPLPGLPAAASPIPDSHGGTEASGCSHARRPEKDRMPGSQDQKHRADGLNGQRALDSGIEGDAAVIAHQPELARGHGDIEPGRRRRVPG